MGKLKRETLFSGKQMAVKTDRPSARPCIICGLKVENIYTGINYDRFFHCGCSWSVDYRTGEVMFPFSRSTDK